jgi:anti-anti-sigma factor
MRLPAPFRCEVSYHDDSWVIALWGELDVATVPEVEAAAAVVRAVQGDVTLDLRGLQFMDASGARLIVGLDAVARRYGFDLGVRTNGGAVQRMLVLSGIDAVVNIVDPLWATEAEPQTQHAVIATDVGGLITLWNREAERLYGWSALEVFGRPIREVLVGPQDRQIAEEIMACVQRTGYWTGEFDVCSKTGSRVRARVRNALITDLDGSITGFVGVSASSSQPALRSA